jgi:hypothetical protein
MLCIEPLKGHYRIRENAQLIIDLEGSSRQPEREATIQKTVSKKVNLLFAMTVVY